MPGLLTFHAHPDDEVIAAGGVLARYSAAGEQVVVVTATDGGEGEVHNYEDPEPIKARLAEVRAAEVAAALAILGVPHHEFLGYRDSGMIGTEANLHSAAFWQADFMEATGRLVKLLRRYRPEVMLIDDPFGGYGHPDHIQVHRVGMASFFGASDVGRFPGGDDGDSFAPSKLYMTAWPRSQALRLAEIRHAEGLMPEEELEAMRRAGTPDEDITAIVDVTDQVERKLEALAAHRTQIPPDWFLINIPAEWRADVLGREGFLRVFSRVQAPFRENDLFAGLR